MGSFRLTIGQYFPTESWFHLLDPRVKILGTFVIIILVFFINSFISYLFLSLFLYISYKVARIPFLYLIKGLKPILFLIFITFIFQMFFYGGEIIYKIWFIPIYKEGLVKGAYLSLRIIFLVTFTSFLTQTTSPLDIADGLEALFKGLKKVGVPVSELALMMSISLRFIPLLQSEVERIAKAQMARGIELNKGNMIKRLSNYIPILIPLFLSSFRRAEELAIAMEARCFKGGEGRTKLRELKMKKSDYIYLISIVFVVILILFFIQ
ncbi:MAG TPA: energy-coupling factor transporter transmembrane protein EcfT [Candidatus Atribacteria bacterium]|nr:energy-coupling factor transporter transmembrane protein EcfT [Candidatus Atribacteria bacterium]